MGSRSALTLLSTLLLVSLWASGCAPASQHGFRPPADAQTTGYAWPPQVSGQHPSEANLAQINSIPVGNGVRREFSPEAQKHAAQKTKTSPQPTQTLPAKVTTGGYSKTTGTPTASLAEQAMGNKCLRKLRALGVVFQTLDHLRGVKTPIQVEGKLGGVEFYNSWNAPLKLDCRLALTLAQQEEFFRKNKIEKFRFSGAYSYRTTRSGRLSHHAHGLAIDIHEVQIDGQLYSVTTDFLRNEGCPGKSPLNRASCAWKMSRVFEEFLTPDYNADHRDHLHVSVPLDPQNPR
ncbi:MAG: extensin family protein [Polyangiaceae bacterium]|nr:extensin family protein [Polyangiaceae bacterium]